MPGLLPVVLDTTPHPHDLDLLQHSARIRFPQSESIHVEPTARLGMSGVRVYRARVRIGSGYSRYFYAKIGLRDKLTDEFKSYRTFIKGRIPDVVDAWPAALAGIEDVCLCGLLAGYSAKEEPQPLADVLPTFDSTSNAQPRHQSICSAIELVYRHLLTHWRNSGAVQRVAWFSAYKWYLRWDRTEPFLRTWLGDSAFDDETFTVGSRSLKSPGHIVRKIEREAYEQDVRYRPVHGDLHQRNIILDSIGDVLLPWLIDFGWTREFHALVDYSLLEASLKLFHFSRFCGEDRYLELHDVLHDETAYRRVSVTEPERAMLDMVHLIRREAQDEVASSAWPTEYYLSSLLVTMGLLSIRTSLPRMVWLTAGWFASHL